MPRETPPIRLQAAGIECVRGARALFRNLDCAVESGGALHLRGENGAGKTSLMQILCGLHRPEAGEVRWNGMPITGGAARADYCAQLAYLGHKPALKGELTPLENLATAAALSGARAGADAAKAALRRMGLRDATFGARCAALSAGQLQRVRLASLLLRRGGVWILDEPAAALDKRGARELETLLAEQIARGGMLVFSSHQQLNVHAQTLDLGDYHQ